MWVIGPEPPHDPSCVFDCGDGLFWDFGSAPYLMGFAVAILVSALVAVLGVRVGRTALLISIASLTGWHIALVPAWSGNALSVDSEALITAAIAVIWFAWIGLNFWCFLGRAGQSFYAKRG